MNYTDTDYDNDNRDNNGDCEICGYHYDHSDDCQMNRWNVSDADYEN